MTTTTPPRSRASPTTSTPEAFASTAPASPLPDLLAGLRWGAREYIAAVAALVLIDIFAGWSYLSSYFGFFRIPVEGLELSMPEVLGQGLRSILLPLTVVFFSFLAPSRHLPQGAAAIGVYLLFLAAVPLATHRPSPGSVAAQLAASIAIGGPVFPFSLGLGHHPAHCRSIGAGGC